MIIANDGVIRVGGGGVLLVEELADIIKCIEKHLADSGMDDDEIEKVIVLAGRLSRLDEQDAARFYVEHISRNGETVSELIKSLEAFFPENKDS